MTPPNPLCWHSDACWEKRLWGLFPRPGRGGGGWANPPCSGGRVPGVQDSTRQSGLGLLSSETSRETRDAQWPGFPGFPAGAEGSRAGAGHRGAHGPLALPLTDPAPRGAAARGLSPAGSRDHWGGWGPRLGAGPTAWGWGQPGVGEGLTGGGWTYRGSRGGFGMSGSGQRLPSLVSRFPIALFTPAPPAPGNKQPAV